jgi:hypothetical protein
MSPVNANVPDESMNVVGQTFSIQTKASHQVLQKEVMDVEINPLD